MTTAAPAPSRPWLFGPATDLAFGCGAVYLAAFAALANDEPLALIEVGASAGLCLYPDRYCYTWATEAGPVSAGEGPRLRQHLHALLEEEGVPLGTGDQHLLERFELRLWTEQRVQQFARLRSR